MSVIVSLIVLILLLVALGFIIGHLDRVEREMRLAEESLESAQLMSDVLEERLDDIDDYRHDLAMLLQKLGTETVRAAEE